MRLQVRPVGGGRQARLRKAQVPMPMPMPAPAPVGRYFASLTTDESSARPVQRAAAWTAQAIRKPTAMFAGLGAARGNQSILMPWKSNGPISPARLTVKMQAHGPNPQGSLFPPLKCALANRVGRPCHSVLRTLAFMGTADPHTWEAFISGCPLPQWIAASSKAGPAHFHLYTSCKGACSMRAHYLGTDHYGRR